MGESGVPALLPDTVGDDARDVAVGGCGRVRRARRVAREEVQDAAGFIVGSRCLSVC